MKFFAGIDGGGTRTRLVLADETGKLLGCAAGGSCSFVDCGIEGAQAELGQLWQGAWGMAGMKPQAVDAIFMGLGSILSRQDVQINRELAVKSGLAPIQSVFAENDAWNAHAGSFFGHPGILLISGTGSACLGRNPQDECWRAGGWGHLLGEQGSAFAVGQAALVAATRAADQRGEPTALTALVCETLALNGLNEIFRKLHHDGVSRLQVAALAPQVVSLAEHGDLVAQQILAKAVDGLVELVLTVARRLQMPAPDLALTGGLIANATGFRRRFLEVLTGKLPDFQLVEGGMAPVFGAVLLAFQHGTGAAPPASFCQTLMTSSQRYLILQ